jgi:hypothetical protein
LPRFFAVDVVLVVVVVVPVDVVVVWRSLTACVVACSASIVEFADGRSL